MIVKNRNEWKLMLKQEGFVKKFGEIGLMKWFNREIFNEWVYAFYYDNENKLIELTLVS